VLSHCSKARATEFDGNCCRKADRHDLFAPIALVRCDTAAAECLISELGWFLTPGLVFYTIGATLG
ncbi:MAG TPA: hypothetical protein VK355_08595, partial [Candidatus Binatia bacterium]|nr:hypothetical protein [Candidatus Binatia bacterium]